MFGRPRQLHAYCRCFGNRLQLFATQSCYRLQLSIHVVESHRSSSGSQLSNLMALSGRGRCNFDWMAAVSNKRGWITDVHSPRFGIFEQYPASPKNSSLMDRNARPNERFCSDPCTLFQDNRLGTQLKIRIFNVMQSSTQMSSLRCDCVLF